MKFKKYDDRVKKFPFQYLWQMHRCQEWALDKKPKGIITGHNRSYIDWYKAHKMLSTKTHVAFSEFKYTHPMDVPESVKVALGISGCESEADVTERMIMQEYFCDWEAGVKIE